MMQTVIPKRGARIIHVETELGIVNIYVGLTDQRGRRVNTVELVGSRCAGEPEIKVVGRRLIELKKRA